MATARVEAGQEPGLRKVGLRQREPAVGTGVGVEFALGRDALLDAQINGAQDEFGPLAGPGEDLERRLSSTDGITWRPAE